MRFSFLFLVNRKVLWCKYSSHSWEKPVIVKSISKTKMAFDEQLVLALWLMRLFSLERRSSCFWHKGLFRNVSVSGTHRQEKVFSSFQTGVLQKDFLSFFIWQKCSKGAADTLLHVGFKASLAYLPAGLQMKSTEKRKDNFLLKLQPQQPSGDVSQLLIRQLCAGRVRLSPPRCVSVLHIFKEHKNRQRL